MRNITHDPPEVEDSRLVYIDTFNENLLLVLVRYMLGPCVEVQSIKF